MRIWSIHPKYLDAKGLVALWRETLLARNVLEGKTKGYKHHPQLDRFKALEYPVEGIDQYLACVFNEAFSRGYSFDRNKFNRNFRSVVIPVTSGQVEYEREHLMGKLKKRDPNRFRQLKELAVWETNPLFEIVEGKIEEWEVI